MLICGNMGNAERIGVGGDCKNVRVRLYTLNGCKCNILTRIAAQTCVWGVFELNACVFGHGADINCLAVSPGGAITLETSFLTKKSFIHTIPCVYDCTSQSCNVCLFVSDLLLLCVHVCCCAPSFIHCLLCVSSMCV